MRKNKTSSSKIQHNRNAFLTNYAIPEREDFAMVIVFLVFLTAFCIAEAYASFQLFKNSKKMLAPQVMIPPALYLIFLLALYLLKISIPYIVLIFYLITVFTHSFIGFYMNLYKRSKTFDRYLHGFGTFSTSLLFYLTLTKLTSAGGSILFQAIFVAALGIAISMVYEVIEFFHDTKSNEKMQRGLRDTDFDMLSNILGGIAAAVFAACFLL